MYTFTTLADFQIVPYSIPSQTGDGAEDTVTPFIAIAEKTNLSALLGFVFHDAFLAALPDRYESKGYEVNDEVLYNNVIYLCIDTHTVAALPTDATKWTAQAQNRWTKILSEQTYVNSLGKKNKWCGMTELCKPLVFAEFVEKFNDYISSMGVVVATVENAKYADAGIRIADGLNTYCKLSCGAFGYLSEVNSLYGYLYSVREDFNDIGIEAGYKSFEEYLCSEFTNPGNVNIFNL